VIGRVEFGNGLRGLAERALTANGRLEAGPQPGGGFLLVVELPLPVVEVAR
jgi:signal transduction histidine kinase